jgi:regulator of protease activity HflC (stomatin/prohibitin superfamily)
MKFQSHSLLYIAFVLITMYIFPSCQIQPEAGQYSVESDAWDGEITVAAGPGVKDWWNMFDDYKYYAKEAMLDFQAIKLENGEYNLDKCLNIKFADFGEAQICGTVRYHLPENDSTMKILHQRYHSQGGVESELIKQTLMRATYLSGPLMTSQESNVVKRSFLLDIIQDQAQFGIYEMVFKDTMIMDIISGKEKVIRMGSPATCKDIIRCPNGLSRSEESPLSQYGIKIYNLTIERIAYSNVVNQQIARQQQTNMQMDSLTIQAKKANTEALIAGENAKARVAEVNAERDAAIAKAQADTEVSRLNSIKAEYDRKIAEQEAKASEAKANVPLTAKERAEFEQKTKIGVAEQLAKAPVPQLIINGDGSKGSTLEQSYGIERMLLLMQQLQNSQRKDEPRP